MVKHREFQQNMLKLVLMWHKKEGKGSGAIKTLEISKIMYGTVEKKLVFMRSNYKIN